MDAIYSYLEIGIYTRDTKRYSAELRFSSPGNDAEVRTTCNQPVFFDRDRLRELELDVHAYGVLLSENLFADSEFCTVFAEACASSQLSGMTIRMSLLIGPGALELHDLRWELLQHPITHECLATNQNILFSRYLTSYDWRKVSSSSRQSLKALVFIANPTDVEDYEPNRRQLTAINVVDELERSKAGLAGFAIETIASHGTATLAHLLEKLREGFDILYIVCHGALIAGQGFLWLENEQGQSHQVAGDELTQCIRELTNTPRLVVLASCQSGGSGEESQSTDGGALSALGPGIALAGVPAVLAMQGNVSMLTMKEFIPCFLKELQRDGQIDRAVAVARGRIRARFDWWSPTLFLRLRSGRLWYTPGFGGEGSMKNWPALLGNIAKGRCTPLLGPGLMEYLVGSRHNLARDWAQTFRFPLPQSRGDLPEVAQFLAYEQDKQFPRDELIRYFQTHLLRQYPEIIKQASDPTNLSAVMKEVWENQISVQSDDPFIVLAELPLPIYVTTNVSSILEHALVKAGKAPERGICRWKKDIDMEPTVFETEPDYRPSEYRPLVYYLYGHIDVPDSLVLTQDDYFDFLIGVTQNKDLVPPSVRASLVNSSLLLLGYPFESWDFRVLFRWLIDLEGSSRRDRYAHVAAQFDPEDSEMIDTERARSYLSSYFNRNANISLYWGASQAFISDLQKELRARENAALP
jgi:hypothetical protein